MEYYKLRIDLDATTISKVVEILDKDTVRYCYVREMIDTNPHVHIYMETTTKQMTIRKHLRELGLKGNGSYSLKETEQNPIEYLAYMMKEGQVINKGIPEDVMENATVYNKKVQEDLKQKKDNKKRVLQLLLERVPTSDESGLQPDKYDELVAKIILEYHIEKQLLLSIPRLKTYYETVKLYKNPFLLGRYVYDIIH